MNLRTLQSLPFGLAIALVACTPPPLPPTDVPQILLDATLDGRDTMDDSAVLPNDFPVELATGQSDYEAISRTNPTLELIYGAQGGYHVWGRARFQLPTPDVDVWFEARLAGDSRPLHIPNPGRRWIADGIRRGLIMLGPNDYATDAELVILEIRCGREVVGRDLTVTVFVRDRTTGRMSAQARTARVVDEIPSPDCAPMPSDAGSTDR